MTDSTVCFVKQVGVEKDFNPDYWQQQLPTNIIVPTHVFFHSTLTYHILTLHLSAAW